jgi:glycosyltransferase involved in cell wall biosynthesis
VVVPSYYNEGLPKVLLEAAASGRGVITTDMPGCADAVDDNLTGMIIPRKDVKALSNAMLKFILDKALISRTGESARIKAEKEFDVKNVISKHIDIYRELSNLRN